MNYGQFLNMIPEAFLVLALIVVFIQDFIITGKQVKGYTLAAMTMGLLAVVTVVCLTAQPAEAFGGMYVATKAANVMKAILSAGTLIVVLMAQPWIESSIATVSERASSISSC